MDNPHLLSIAPMIDWTNKYFRMLMRLLAPKAILYTEMQACNAILNNVKRTCEFNLEEHPVVLQLGGYSPKILAQCAYIGESLGFAEINLNIGCPSSKVLHGRFGACLMAEPKTVFYAIDAMKKSIKIPVTAKIRLGIDNQDSYDFFANFAKNLISAGSDKIIIHARKAWLKGLNPKQNRTIPPINYEFVYNLKQEVGNYPIIINGDIKTIEQIKTHLRIVDGVMLGRLVCRDPYAIVNIHKNLYKDIPLKDRSDVVKDYIEYFLGSNFQYKFLSLLLKPLLNMASNIPNSKKWKQYIMHIQKTKDISLLYNLPNLMAFLDTPVGI